MCAHGDLRVTEDGEAVLIHRLPVRVLTLLVSGFRVLKSLSGAFVPGLVVLFFMSLGGAPVRVRRDVV
jgi:hypothetical protein